MPAAETHRSSAAEVVWTHIVLVSPAALIDP